MPRAAIDIGSNSLLLTVLDDDGNVLHDQATVVGLGRGLGDQGMFAKDRMAAAEEVLVQYAATALTLGVQPESIRAVATSAARRAMNAETWMAKMTKRHQLRIRIISGEEEAQLSWIGATKYLEVPDGPLLVVDLGGGSTELVNGRGPTVYERVSLEVGSVRLTESLLSDPVDTEAILRARNHIDIELLKMRFQRQPVATIGVAGTVTTLSAMVQDLTTWDADKIQGSELTSAALRAFVAVLAPATPEERAEMAAVAPERAPYLLAGAIILERVLHHAGHKSMIVSDKGLRYGLLQQ